MFTASVWTAFGIFRPGLFEVPDDTHPEKNIISAIKIYALWLLIIIRSYCIVYSVYLALIVIVFICFIAIECQFSFFLLIIKRRRTFSIFIQLKKFKYFSFVFVFNNMMIYWKREKTLRVKSLYHLFQKLNRWRSNQIALLVLLLMNVREQLLLANMLKYALSLFPMEI